MSASAVNRPTGGANRLISVIIPCFGQAHFLSEAIESVLRQSHATVEIIVVDDGSPDDVAAVARRYDGVRCIRQENRGQASARNAGLQTSRGEFVVFLDADDKLMPNALEIGASRLSESPEVGITFGQVRSISRDGSPLVSREVRVVQSDCYKALLEFGNFINTPAAAMFRRSVLMEVGGFDETLRGAEDYELYLRIVRVATVLPHPNTVAERRRHAGSSTTRPLRRLPSVLAVWRKHWRYVKGHPDYERAYRVGLRRWRSGYGPVLVGEMVTNAKSGNWQQVVRGAAALLRHPVLAWHAVRGIVVRIVTKCLGVNGSRTG